MSDLNTQEQETLQRELAQALQKLDGFEGELQSIDVELEDISSERQRYDLLREVCGGLEKLRELGGESFFWTGPLSEFRSEDHIALVLGRVDEFQQRISEIEGRRKGVFEKIQRAEEDAELLEDDLLEAVRKEEERKLEWLVERDVSDLPSRIAVMPWTRGGEDDQRLRKSLTASLLLSILLGLVLPMIDLPVPDRWQVIDVPERLTRLIKEERTPPPPPPPMQAENQPVETETAIPEESELAQSSSPEPDPQQQPKPAPRAKGILAFRDKFAGLAASKPTALLGAQAHINRSGETSSGRPERSLVATQAPGSSGGINLAALSRDVGGGGGQQIEGVQLTRATSSIGGIGASERPLSGGPGPGRTDEEIQIVFDRHKAALYRLYNHELLHDYV